MSRVDKRAARIAEHTRWKQYRAKACVVCGADADDDEGEWVDLYGNIHAARLVDFQTEHVFSCFDHDDDAVNAAIEALARP
jgi:hypothetical protein